MAPDTAPYASCRDVVPASTIYPRMDFLIYHAGYEPDNVERAFDPKVERRGTDTLIHSLLRSGIGHGSNVYAEIGASWRSVMKDPTQASHVIGKLLKYIGEDNILWGTDSLVVGSPQDQIQAFQTFQISREFQERYAYPALNDSIRAKIFGLNAARVYGLADTSSEHTENRKDDPLQRVRALYAEQADPSFMSDGPRTRAEFIHLAQPRGAH